MRTTIRKRDKKYIKDLFKPDPAKALFGFISHIHRYNNQSYCSASVRFRALR